MRCKTLGKPPWTRQPCKVYQHEDSHMRITGYGMDQATRASTPRKTTSVHHIRHIVIEAKQRQLSPVHHLRNRIVRQLLQPSSLSLSLLSLLVQIDLQEPVCCLWAIISLHSVLDGPQSESGFEGLMPHLSFCCLPITCLTLSLSIRFPTGALLDLSYPRDF